MYENDQVKLHFGEREIVFHQPQPFPLFPGQYQGWLFRFLDCLVDRLEGVVNPLPYVNDNEALLLQSKIKFTDRFTGQKVRQAFLSFSL